MKNNHIGVVGITYPGTIRFLENVYAFAKEKGPQSFYPNVTMSMRSLHEYLDSSPEDWESLVRDTLDKLVRAGCDLIVSPANTTQSILQRIISEYNLGWIHIAHPVVDDVKERGFRKILLIATGATLESGLYQAPVNGTDIELVAPSLADQKRIDEIIYSELIHGDILSESSLFLTEVMERSVIHGCEAVIFGCTELCLTDAAFKQRLPVLDSNELLARKAIEVWGCSHRA